MSKLQKKNKEFKMLYLSKYKGLRPCPNCHQAEEAFEIVADDTKNKNFWTPTYKENKDPKARIFRETKEKIGTPTLYHAGSLDLGRFTTDHYRGHLRRIQEEYQEW